MMLRKVTLVLSSNINLRLDSEEDNKKEPFLTFPKQTKSSKKGLMSPFICTSRLFFTVSSKTKCSFWQTKSLKSQRAFISFPPNIILNPYYFLAMFPLSSHYVKHAHNTYTEAIPQWRTECTRGLIYYTVLTIPRTITASLSNRLKMASCNVYEQTLIQARQIWILQDVSYCLLIKSLWSG